MSILRNSDNSKLLFVIFGIASLLDISHSFSFTRILSQKASATIHVDKVRNETPLYLSSEVAQGGSLESDFGGDGWMLKEDWALLDSVPGFTVQSSYHGLEGVRQLKTFWTQLKHSTPELSSRTEVELEGRYQKLSLDKKSGRQDFIGCGPSPPLLSDWWVNDNGGNGENALDDISPLPSGAIMMSGILTSGSKIWFPLQRVGTLSDNTACYEIPMVSPLTISSVNPPNGLWNYAEANGGCIYELGSRKVLRNRVGSLNMESKRNVDIRSWASHAANGKKWMSSLNNNMLLIAGLFLVSAGISFSAGQQYAPASSSSPASSGQVAAIVIRTRDISTTPVRTTNSYAELSIVEMRARQEVRVNTEKRAMARIQDRLKGDEAKLTELQNEEARQEASSWGF